MIQQKIAAYKFEDAKNMVTAVLLVHLFFVLLMIVQPDFSIRNERFILCAITTIALAVSIKIYDWLNNKVNFAVIIVYLLFFTLELVSVGQPETLNHYISPNPSSLSKGSFMEVLMGIIPTAYLVMRLLLAIPFFLVYRAARQLTPL